MNVLILVLAVIAYCVAPVFIGYQVAYKATDCPLLSVCITGGMFVLSFGVGVILRYFWG